jgi:single-stranded DNA-binding protein
MTAIITITGRLGADAESKTIGGKTVVALRVAVDQYEGPGKDKTTAWYSVTAWGERWGWLLQHATKGARVCVVGELKRRDYDGAKGAGVSLDVSATSIDVFPGDRGASDRSPAGGSVDDADIPF